MWSDIPPVRHKSTKRRAANELSIKLLRRVLEISTQPGDVVLDPFGGSGTTYAAAEEMHRHWIGAEIGDCEPIIRRLSGEAANVPPKNLGDAAKGTARRRRAHVVQPALGLFSVEAEGSTVSVDALGGTLGEATGQDGSG